jgi:hypothetical protein
LGVSIKESEVDLDNVTLTDNRIGLQSIDSDVMITNSDIHDNEIDVLIHKTCLKLIDFIMEKLAFDGRQMLLQKSPNSLYIDTTLVKDLSKEVLRTRNPKVKRKKAREILKYFWKHAKDSYTAYAILKEIIKLWGKDFSDFFPQ